MGDPNSKGELGMEDHRLKHPIPIGAIGKDILGAVPKFDDLVTLEPHHMKHRQFLLSRNQHHLGMHRH